MSLGLKRARSVHIIQSYVPEYRRPLFEKLRVRLSDSGVMLTVVTADPSRIEALRRDEAILNFQTKVRGISVTVRKRSVRWKGVWKATKSADLIVCELGSLVLENYPLALWRNDRLVAWGHGYAATTKPNPVDSALERFLMRRSRLFLAYTDQGRIHALRNGLAEEHVVVLRNTVDTAGLEQAIEQSLTAAAASSDWDLSDEDIVCAYVGALDQSKRLDFLLAVADDIWRQIPAFKLLIAGDGPDRDLICEMVRLRPYLRYVGRVGDLEKAQIAVQSKLMLNPGRVGLVAVDSFVMGLPIVTTNWTAHAPEFDYLMDEVNAVVVEDDEQTYVRAVVELLQDEGRRLRLVEGCRMTASELSMDALVERFAAGILGVLDGSIT